MIKGMTLTMSVVILSVFTGIAHAGITSVASDRDEVPVFGKFEVTVGLDAAYSNPFDPEEVDLSAVFTDPAGRQCKVDGFLYSAQQDSSMNYTNPVWKIRFSPAVEGTWKYDVNVRTKDGSDNSGRKKFKCVPSKAKGFVKVSAADPRYFEFSNGDFYYPAGENICWASLAGFRKYFAGMQEAGCNWTRVWMSNWESGLEWTKGSGYRGLGRYNLEKADKLDKIIDLAREYGLYVQLVINHHGQLSTRVNPQWDDNPYNARNAGPCKEPGDFFTDPAAKRYFKNRMRYIIARWGYSPNVMAWELWNELTFVDDLDLDMDAAWHKEMASYIKEKDPYKHLITTSYAGTFHDYGFNEKVWEIPEIDYTQFHMYTQDVVSAIIGAYRLMSRFEKPYFMAEIGTDSTEGVDKKDLDGAYLHAAIWSQYMLSCAGNAMPWWWDSYVHPKNMYYHWAALTAFDKGTDRRGKGYRMSTSRVLAEVGGLRTCVSAIGMMNDREGFIWVFDPAWTRFEPGRPEPPEIKNASVRINGLAEGKYKVEFWDTLAGTVVGKADVVSDANGLDIALPAFMKDMAVKVVPAGYGPSGRKKAVLADTVPAPVGPARKSVTVRRAKQHIKVDGDLSEWYLTDLSGDQAALLDNGAARFYLLYDNDNLYLAAEVEDDFVIGNQRGVDIWRDDTIELWIDARADADTFNNMPFNPGCYQINIAPLTKDGMTGVYVYRNINTRPLAEAVKAASKVWSGQDKTGYTIEAAIPVQAVYGLDLKDGKTLGVNFSVTDRDTEKGKWRHAIWSGQREDDATQWGRLKVKN